MSDRPDALGPPLRDEVAQLAWSAAQRRAELVRFEEGRVLGVRDRAALGEPAADLDRERRRPLGTLSVQMTFSSRTG